MWLFGKRSVTPASTDVQDRLQALERGLRRVTSETEELHDELARRMGKVYGLLKALRKDDPEPAEPVAPPAPPGLISHAQLELLRNRRRQR